KSRPLLARACRFDRSIQRQQIGAEAHVFDRRDQLVDLDRGAVDAAGRLAGPLGRLAGLADNGADLVLEGPRHLGVVAATLHRIPRDLEPGPGALGMLAHDPHGLAVFVDGPDHRLAFAARCRNWRDASAASTPRPPGSCPAPKRPGPGSPGFRSMS